MEITITYELSDWQKYQQFVQKSFRNEPRTLKEQAISLFFWLAIIATGVAANWLPGFHWPSFCLTAIFFIAILCVIYYDAMLVSKKMAPCEQGFFLGTHRIIFTEDGIKVEGDGYQSFHQWSIVKKIERSEGMILVFVDKILAYVLPEQKLADPEAFYKELQRFYHLAHTS